MFFEIWKKNEKYVFSNTVLRNVLRQRLTIFSGEYYQILIDGPHAHTYISGRHTGAPYIFTEYICIQHSSVVGDQLQQPSSTK